MRPIPRAALMWIAVPTTLIWGRHDLQTRLRVAEAASGRYGWPLYVIEGRDGPFFEQPEAAVRALRPCSVTPDLARLVQRLSTRRVPWRA
jgi:pimeloyl-ACP methyl ester carboxylesterase